MAFDASTGNTVLFGGFTASGYLGDTWIWDGSDWTQQNPTNSPSARYVASMAFDASTGNMVLFGGSNGSTELDDTWTWDGTNWTERNPANSPPARADTSMAFDPSSGNTVLFGGFAAIGFLGDTWTWDGSDWTKQNPASSPPARAGVSMAFDPSSGNTILFGGSNGGGFLSDTWTWDGTNWTQQSPADSPPVRYGASMAFDPSTGSMILFGGYGGAGAGYFDVTWIWDGSNWTQQTPAGSPSARYFASMAFDPSTGSMILFGGLSDNGFLGETWAYGPPTGLNSNWTEQLPASRPAPRRLASMAFDASAGNTILFGGSSGSGFLNDTWTWDGTNWTQQTPADSPPVRYGASMAFDPSTGNVILFGGYGGGGAGYLGDTWIWDGSNWTQQTPADSPPVRYGASMAFDPSTGNMILFGGANSSGNSPGGTWTWDGSNWTQLTPANSPPARALASMAFDPSTGNMILFGGSSGGNNLGDTWIWDGSNWNQPNPASSPPARALASMAFDPSTGNMILFGGSNGGSNHGDTWIWDGSNWSQQNPASSPPARSSASMAFDPSTGNIVLFGGGSTGGGYLNETWIYSLQADPPAAAIASPAGGSTFVIGETVATAFSCEEGPGGPGLASCLDSNGDPSPTGELNTSSLGNHSYTVTATSENNLTDEAETSYEVVQAIPTLIPAGATSVETGQPITVSANLTGGYQPGGSITFTAHGPDDSNCSSPPVFASPPVTVDGDGTYTSPGFTPEAAGSYRWIASYTGDTFNEPVVSSCETNGSISTVSTTPPPPPPPPPPPVCPAIKLGFNLGTFKPNRPFGDSPKVPGTLASITTGSSTEAKITPRYRYRTGKKTRTATLKTRTIRIDQARRFRFGIPAGMKRHIRQARGRLFRTPVTLQITASLKQQGTPDSCFQQTGTKKVQTRITAISSRVALRRNRSAQTR